MQKKTKNSRNIPQAGDGTLIGYKQRLLKGSVVTKQQWRQVLYVLKDCVGGVVQQLMNNVSQRSTAINLFISPSTLHIKIFREYWTCLCALWARTKPTI